MMDEKKGLEEIKDDDLDLVAGGKYTEAEWATMSYDERVTAKRNSAILISQGKKTECKYVN